MLPCNKTSCLVIDDEPFAREILKQHIAGVESLKLVGTCQNAVEAFTILKEQAVELLFLDIQMPQLLGTHLIRALKSPPKVIFTTAYRKYAVEGFELDAVDYLLKPITFDRFFKAVGKVLQSNLSTGNTTVSSKSTHGEQGDLFLYFRVERKMVKVFFKDILFIEALKDYVKIFTTVKTIVTKHLLSALSEMLPADEFLRIHRSYIVAINKIESYKADSVEIARQQLPIGRLFKHDVDRVLTASSAQ